MKTPDFVADIKVDCKTIEDIKKWLACLAVTYTDECSGECETCEYDVGEKESVGMCGKILAYIQHLESRLAQVERERDAAVTDLMTASMNLCSACKYDSWPECGKTGRLNLDADDAVACKHFEWRGVCDENTKEDADENTEKV